MASSCCAGTTEGRASVPDGAVAAGARDVDVSSEQAATAGLRAVLQIDALGPHTDAQSDGDGEQEHAEHHLLDEPHDQQAQHAEADQYTDRDPLQGLRVERPREHIGSVGPEVALGRSSGDR